MGRRGAGRRSKGGRGRSSLPAIFDVELPADEELAFDLGARVELLNLKDDHPWDPPHTGTVVRHWKRKDDWPAHMKAPYLVLLDDGMAVYCLRTDADAIRATDVPPMELTFGIGSRVECRFEKDGKWFPGTVIQRHDEWVQSPLETPPYLINFDYGRERPFWGPADCIRASKTTKSGNKFDDRSLRFKIGDRVECFVEDEYSPGIVVNTWYYEESFEDGYAVPYQVDHDGAVRVLAMAARPPFLLNMQVFTLEGDWKIL